MTFESHRRERTRSKAHRFKFDERPADAFLNSSASVRWGDAGPASPGWSRAAAGHNRRARRTPGRLEPGSCRTSGEGRGGGGVRPGVTVTVSGG